MGFADWPTFMQHSTATASKVTRHFEQVFAAPQSTQDSHPLAALWHGHCRMARKRSRQLAELGYRHAAETWQRLSSMREGSRYSAVAGRAAAPASTPCCRR